MDITIGNDSVLAGVPRQRGDDGESYRAALAELAAVASAHVSEREQVRAEVDDERVIDDAAQERTRSAWRTVGVVALVTAIAAAVVTMVLTVPRQPHATGGQPAAVAASVATARELGGSARTRLTAAGSAATLAACLAAYAADSAASPQLLPSPAQPTAIRDKYVAACLAA